jgi:hypothetical protein
MSKIRLQHQTGSSQALLVKMNFRVQVSKDPKLHRSGFMLKLTNAKEHLRIRLQAAGWSSGEIELAVRLNSRGKEPLLPLDWELPFDALPTKLFGNDTVINAMSENSFYATQSFERLLGLGSAVRANKQSKKPVEALMQKEIERYVRWAACDAGVNSKRYRPVIFYSTSKEGKDDRGASHRMEETLRNKARKYRDELAMTPSIEHTGDNSSYLHPPPTLFGFLISRHKLAILTHAADVPNASMRCIGIFDFGSTDMDVWNAVAVAYVVIQARDWLAGLRRAYDDQGGNGPASGEPEDLDQ